MVWVCTLSPPPKNVHSRRVSITLISITGPCRVIDSASVGRKVRENCDEQKMVEELRKRLGESLKVKNCGCPTALLIIIICNSLFSSSPALSINFAGENWQLRRNKTDLLPSSGTCRDLSTDSQARWSQVWRYQTDRWRFCQGGFNKSINLLLIL